MCHITRANVFSLDTFPMRPCRFLHELSFSILECRAPADVVFIMDASGSIHEDRFVETMDFIKNIVVDLPISAGGRASLITFSKNTTLHFDIDTFESKTQVHHISIFFFCCVKIRLSG